MDVFRADDAVKQMELRQKHDSEETAALEKMMQKVESNLEATTVVFTSCSIMVYVLVQETIP